MSDVADVEFGDADALGDFGDDGVGDIADFVLRIEQHGDRAERRRGYFSPERRSGLPVWAKRCSLFPCSLHHLPRHASAAISISSSPALLANARFRQFQHSVPSVVAPPITCAPLRSDQATRLHDAP